MTDAHATMVGFVLSFSILLGYAVWLVIEHRCVMKNMDARNRERAANGARPRPTEPTTTELKPPVRVRVS